MPRYRRSDLGGMLHLACLAVRDDLGGVPWRLRGGRWLSGGGLYHGDAEERVCKPWAEETLKVDCRHMEETSC